MLSLVLPATFGHTTACRSPALTFSAAIHFAMKRSTPLFRRLASFTLVLDCCRPLVRVDTESSEVVPETPHSLFFLPPQAARAPHQISEHHALRQSRVLYARHKFLEQDPPPAHNGLDALTCRLDGGVQVGNRVVDAMVLSPTDEASQEAMVGSVQRVVGARAWALRDAVAQQCLEYLDSYLSLRGAVGRSAPRFVCF